MCGIAGFAGFRAPELLERMTRVMSHRGPDDEGFYHGPSAELGCRRLSIIDVAGGHQPMANAAGTVVVVQNGEIYNYQELRETLRQRGYRFRTQCDTEVLLYAYEAFGEDFPRELNGDFAIAIWDSQRDTLLLARDRLGVHPLYYAQVGAELVFASELKSLLCWSKAPRELDHSAIDMYLTLRYVPQGRTLFAQIQKLPPASLLVFRQGRASVTSYWRAEEGASLSEAELHDDPEKVLEHLLRDAVRLRMRSDVPVGAYLSGGLDSSLIVALMRSWSAQPVRTFCIGFPGTGPDERKAAACVARRLGTTHEELTVGERDFELLPTIVWHQDEPIGDAIVIPTYRLSQAASRHVKVVLSGEGADEVWGGYVHHVAVSCGTALKQYVPGRWLKTLGGLVRRLPQGMVERAFPYPAALGKRGRRALADYLTTLSAGTLEQEYLLLASVYRPEDKTSFYTRDFCQTLARHQTFRGLFEGVSPARSRLGRVMALDLSNWLPDYTLLKQDKLGLANSLEVRVPYLDHRIVEFAAQLPSGHKIRRLTTKRLLRQVSARVVPRDVARAPKQAFLFPFERVFGRLFDDYVRAMLESPRTRARGIFSQAYLAERAARIRTSELLENKQLMALVMLELWFRTFVDGDGQQPVSL